jgi:hypothetical protein
MKKEKQTKKEEQALLNPSNRKDKGVALRILPNRKNSFGFRNSVLLRREAMIKAQIRDSLRASYANRFSSKNEPRTERPMNNKKLKKIRTTYRKCILLSQQIEEREKKGK